MPVTYGFYDSLASDRAYNADQISRLFEGIINDGVFQGIGSALVVTANSGMNINVGTGRAWFLNTWTHNDAVLGLTVAASHPTLNRIDSVILEVDKTTGVRANSIKMLSGTAATTPVAPGLLNTATKKQVSLADIYIGAAVTSIITANITNKVGTVGTPFITGIVDIVDTATLLAQYEAKFASWFANLENQLTTEQHTNLQNQITALNQSWYALTGSYTYVSADAPSFVMNFPDAVAANIDLGNKIKLTQTSLKFFVVVKKGTPSGGNTPITLHGGTDYVLANAAVTNPFVSRENNPIGFPINKFKSYVLLTDTTQRLQNTPDITTWYNPGGLSLFVPIGYWRLKWVASPQFTEITAGTALNVTYACTLSATADTEGVADLTARLVTPVPNTLSPSAYRLPIHLTTYVDYTVKTQLFANLQVQNSGIDSIQYPNHLSLFRVTLECAYL